MAKKVSIKTKPATRTALTPDEWVSGSRAPAPAEAPKEEKVVTTRYTIDIPTTLHARIKSQCALNHVKMRDEILALLEKHFAG
jgi:hypothetical protein